MPGIETFSLGFWHPFGPHGRQMPEQILTRKRNEIGANGWTLWSFQNRHTLRLWYDMIVASNPQNVLVFCSDSKNARDPTPPVVDCSYYRMINEDSWRPMPSAVNIPHPIGKKTEASAFVVADIIHPLDETELFPVQWWCKIDGGTWRDNRVPTRGEYLIRQGGTVNIRRYLAMLVLKPPYLALLSTVRPNEPVID